jgi:hypothetical protein
MTTQEMGSTAGGENAGGSRERAVETVAEVDAAAMHVAGVAGDEAGRVARDAKEAARGFFDETKTQLSEQATAQQQRAAEALRTTGDELSEMSRSSSGGGLATGLVRSLGDQTKHAASWLEQREPGDLVREVRGFARRHTGVFLVAALGVGLVAGRLTRALVSDGKGADAASGSASGAQGGAPRATPVGAAGATGTGGATGMGAGGAMPGGTGAGGTPIGDSLAAGSSDAATVRQGMSRPEVPPTGASTQDEWSPSGEAQR